MFAIFHKRCLAEVHVRHWVPGEDPQVTSVIMKNHFYCHHNLPVLLLFQLLPVSKLQHKFEKMVLIYFCEFFAEQQVFRVQSKALI